MRHPILGIGLFVVSSVISAVLWFVTEPDLSLNQPSYAPTPSSEFAIDDTTFIKQVKASLSEDAAWQVSTNSGHVRYSTHGTIVYGHKFGFVKLARRCDDDILWLSWSSDDPRVKRLVKSKVKLLIDVDGISFRIGVDLTTASSLIPLTTVVLFTNFLVGPTFVDLLNQGKKIGITISGPPSASQLFDIRSDEFTLAGFAVARQQAKKTCEERVI